MYYLFYVFFYISLNIYLMFVFLSHTHLTEKKTKQTQKKQTLKC